MSMIGTRGADLLAVHDGGDFARGKAGNDTLLGGTGNDSLFGDNGLDLLYGNNGNDLIRGHYGDDTLHGEGGDDELSGGRGNDLITGGDGIDWIRGDRGDDTLYDHAGISNRLEGGPGADTLIAHMLGDSKASLVGGEDGDRFQVVAQADGLGSTVWVEDFRPGEDVFDLSLRYADGSGLDAASIFAVLDTNGNRVLGDDVPWDGNSEVYSSIATNELVIRLHEDHVVLQGVTSLAAADWLLG